MGSTKISFLWLNHRLGLFFLFVFKYTGFSNVDIDWNKVLIIGVVIPCFEFSLLMKAFVTRHVATKVAIFLFARLYQLIANSTFIRRQSLPSLFSLLENLVFYVEIDHPPTNYKMIRFILIFQSLNQSLYFLR